MMWNTKSLPPELIGWDGKVRARFGGEHPIAESTQRMGVVIPVDSAHIWMASGNAYVLDLLQSDGTSKRRLTRNVDWFPAGQETTGLPWQVPPRPKIHSVSVDSAGRVWVLIRRAHRRWQADPRFGNPQGPIRSNALPSTFDSSRFFESVIEVFDPKTGDVIASTILPGTFLEFVQSGVLYEIRESENGLVRLALVHVGLAASQ